MILSTEKEKILFFMEKSFKLTKYNTFNNVSIIEVFLIIDFYQFSRISGKTFSTTLLFPIFKVKFPVAEIIKQFFF